MWEDNTEHAFYNKVEKCQVILNESLFINSQLEVRAEVEMDDGWLYTGEWIIGTNIR